MTNYFLAVEWSTPQIILACFKKIGKTYRLFKLDRLNILPDNSPQTSLILRQWVENTLPKTAQISAVLTLPESLIFLKELELPKAKDKELSEAIFWEVSDIANTSSSQAVVQWKKISEDDKLVRVSAMVIKAEVAEQFLSIFKEAGLKLVAIEPSSLSFSRIIDTNLEKTTLMIHIEKDESNFVILHAGFPVFSSSLAISLKGMKTKKRRLDQEVKALLLTNAKQIVSFWQDREKEKIRQIILTGSGIKYSGLARAINDFAHVPTFLGKPKVFKSRFLINQPKTTQIRHLIPLGAALRFISSDSYKEITLLPEKEKQRLEKETVREDRLQKIYLFSKINFIFSLFILLLLVIFKIWSVSLSGEIVQTKIFVDRHPAQKYIPEISNTNRLLGQIELLVAGQKDIGQRLKQISQLTPANIEFKSLKLTSLPNERWEIEGKGDRNEILAFYEKLKTEAEAKEVTMPYSSLQKEKESNFKIILIW